MSTEADILRAVPDILRQWVSPSVSEDSLSAEPGRGEGDLILRFRDHVFIVQVQSSAETAHVSQAVESLRQAKGRLGGEPTLLVAVPFMGETGKRICEQKKVCYLDLSGNAHIEAPGLLIHMEGRPNKFVKRGRPMSAFASRSSRVARVLLRDPQRWWLQQDLTGESGLGKGFVSRIVRRLEEDRLVGRNDVQQVRPTDPGMLLDAWRSDYSFDRHEAFVGHVTARTGEELVGKVAQACKEHGIEFAVTGLAGAAMLAPFAAYRRVTVFVEEPPGEGLLQQLKFRHGERGANLWLVRPKDEAVFWDARSVDGLRCASPVQVYLDLKGMPERAEEAAEHLRSTCLNWSKDA